MTIKDVIKEKVYAGLIGGAGWTLSDMLLIFGVACLIAVYIFMVYKLMSKAAFYSKDLNITIAGMVVVVAAIMIAMQSSLIVSLGMVGALSIVRFRNAVKNPMDLLYLFWAVSAGIICGVGLYLLAIILCIIMTGLLFILDLIPESKANALLVLSGNNAEVDWRKIKNIVEKYSKYSKEKSRSIDKIVTEVIFEVKTSQEEELLEKLRKEEGLHRINYLMHDGEFRG